MINSLEPSGTKSQFDKAVTLRSRGKLDEASDILRVLAKKSPRSAAVIGYLAGLHFEQREFDKSASLFKKVVRLSPRSELASLGLFHSYIELGKDSLARHEMRRFVALQFSRQYADMLNDVNPEEFGEAERSTRAEGPVAWRMVQQRLFPLSTPGRAEWQDMPSIVETLNTIGGFGNYNHAFIPEGGGADLLGAITSAEDNCIELHFDQAIIIIRPRRVLFESFSLGPAWSYFRIETHPLPSIGSSSSETALEELMEIGPGKYAPLKDDAAAIRGSWEPRSVTRCLQGDFVIFEKTSVYNRFDAYGGSHARMKSDEFRTTYEKLLEVIRSGVKSQDQQELIVPEWRRSASERGVSSSHRLMLPPKSENIH